MVTSTIVPGFRFHPTDEELAMYFLKRKLLGKKLIDQYIAEVNIYDFSPWDLPDKSKLVTGDLEWFFFCPTSKKYSCGSRTNRATEIGYWKATGKDRPVHYKGRTVSMIKTLVFHCGHAPKGERTDWVMHEYRMNDNDLSANGIIQDSYVICKIFKKGGAGPQNGAHYGAPFNEDEWNDDAGPSESSAVVGHPSAAADPNACTPMVTTNVARTTSILSESAPGPSSIITASPSAPVTPSITTTKSPIASAATPSINEGFTPSTSNAGFVSTASPFEELFTEAEIAEILGGTGQEDSEPHAECDKEKGIFDELEDLLAVDDGGDFDMSGSKLKPDMLGLYNNNLEASLRFFY